MNRFKLPWKYKYYSDINQIDIENCDGELIFSVTNYMSKGFINYLKFMITAVNKAGKKKEDKNKYNPSFGDYKVCECGHFYYRHFDSYEDMKFIGCKYCSCHKFKEMKID
jgi:hypothetical protein